MEFDGVCHTHENWSKEAKYVFGVVKSISDKVCEKLSPSSEDDGDAGDHGEAGSTTE